MNYKNYKPERYRGIRIEFVRPFSDIYSFFTFNRIDFTSQGKTKKEALEKSKFIIDKLKREGMTQDTLKYVNVRKGDNWETAVNKIRNKKLTFKESNQLEEEGRERFQEEKESFTEPTYERE